MKVEITAALCIGESYGKPEVIMTTIEQLAGITSQHNEIVKRVCNGTLDPAVVKRSLQDIIEGKSSSMLNWAPPTWWVNPQDQLERASLLWPDIILPDAPMNFVPQTKTEVLLLHVPDTFDTLWSKVDTPDGYTKSRWDGVKANKQNLRLAPNKVEFAVPVWLAFDPEHGKGERPDALWGHPGLAASEVISALIQFPGWSLAWFNGASAPNLSGYQFKHDGNWSRVPYLYRWDDGRQLELDDIRADYRNDYWSSPQVREC